jgi:hypothetical protein
MKGSLAGRLARIRSATPPPRTETAPAAAADRSPPPVPAAAPTDMAHVAAARAFFDDGWTEAAPMLLSRTAVVPLAFPVPQEIHDSFPAINPTASALFPRGEPLAADRLLLFDLETTGLSGGAGTIAFLAAFGRLAEGSLTVSQYLLLDYPGEAAFVERLLAEIVGEPCGGAKPVLVTYNGKSFDMQLLKTRCLMNGEAPPDPEHLDLVHPSRRLWRRTLSDCSLATIEREVLGIERGPDLGGAEAPEAWFDFLKRGDAGRLKRICEHNSRDLVGLAALLSRLDRIVRDPLRVVGTDAEALALGFLSASKKAGADFAADEKIVALLDAAVARGSFRAAFALGRRAFRPDSRFLLRAVAAAAFPDRASFYRAPIALRVAAYRLLARDALRLDRDPAAAGALIGAALDIEGLSPRLRDALEVVRARLSRKDGEA